MKHGEYWVQHSAAQLFKRLKVNPEMISEVAPATAADAAPPHPAFPVLTDLLMDPDRDLRLAAVVAFQHLHERNAQALLQAAANDPDRNVQIAVRHALAALE